MIFALASGWFWRHVSAPLVTERSRAHWQSVLAAALVSFHCVHIWADAVGYEPFLEQTEVLPMRYAATAKRMLRAHGVNLRELRSGMRTDDAPAAAGCLTHCSH